MRYLLTFLMILIASFSTFAQEIIDSDTEKIETGAVKVTASKVEKELLDVPASVSIITSEEIERTSARTVGELLEDVPGIQISNSGSQGLKRISIRGEGTLRTLILIDGQEIVENKSYDGTPLLIDPSMIERIEVIRGPASVLYGSDALGGVINIITKKGGDKPIQGTLSLSYNGASAGLAESLSLYGSAAGVEYRVTAAYNDQDQLRTPIGLAPYSAFDQQNYSAYLAYNFAKHFKIGASYDYFDADIMSGSQEEYYENFYVDIPIWTRQKAAAFFEMKEVASFMPKLRLDFFFQESHKYMHNHVDTITTPALLDNYADNYNTQYGVSLQTDWAIGKHTYIIFGYDFNYNIIKGDTDTFATYQTGWDELEGNEEYLGMGSMFESVLNYDKYTTTYGYEQIHALYASAEHYLPVDFTLSYGVRWTYNYADMITSEGTKYDRYYNTIETLVQGEDIGPVGESFDNAPVFAAGLMWSGIENFTARFNFSQGFRTPSLQERYILSTMGGGTSLPNPDLVSETSNNFELGIRYNDYGVNVDAVYFLSMAQNYIATEIIDSSSSTTRNVNIANALSHGAELHISYNTPINLKPYITLTIMKRKYEDGDGSYTWNTGVPLVYGRGGLRYIYTFNNIADLKIDLFSRFASETKDMTDFTYLYTYGAWGTLNLSIGVDFGKNREYSLAAEVYNMTNATYQISSSIYEPAVYGAVKFVARF